MKILDSLKSLVQEDTNLVESSPDINQHDISDQQTPQKNEPIPIYIHTYSMPPINAIEIFSPTNYEGCQQIADALKAGKVAIVNYYYTLESIVTKIQYFMDGFIYASEGYQEKVTRYTYVYAPHTTTIQREESVIDDKLHFPWGGR